MRTREEIEAELENMKVALCDADAQAERLNAGVKRLEAELAALPPAPVRLLAFMSGDVAYIKPEAYPTDKWVACVMKGPCEKYGISYDTLAAHILTFNQPDPNAEALAAADALAEAEMFLSWSCSDVKDNPGAAIQTVKELRTALLAADARAAGFRKHNHQLMREKDDIAAEGFRNYEKMRDQKYAEFARAEALAARLTEAERERDVFAQYHGGHLPTCGGLDEIERRCDCGYLQGEAYRGLVEELDAARAELAALGPVEWQVNTDAIGWRQSTDVEVQHIRSFAVDRVRAIRVVNQ